MMRTVAFLAMIALLVVANCYATCLVNPHSASARSDVPPCHQKKAPVSDEADGCSHDLWKEQRAAQEMLGDLLIAGEQPAGSLLGFFSNTATLSADRPAAAAAAAPLCLRI